jgi:Predicted membrane protein
VSIFENEGAILHILKYIEVIISVVSVLIVVYGTVSALAALLKTEFLRVKSKYSIQQLRVIRADLGTYLLLALEVLIAADIIKSIIEPDLIDLGILAGIVTIRTVLSVFLNKEIQEIDKERSENPDVFSGM